MDLFAKFQPSSFKIVVGDGRDETYFFTIPKKNFEHPSFASLRSIGRDKIKLTGFFCTLKNAEPSTSKPDPTLSF